jgi:hypothetical protein
MHRLIALPRTSTSRLRGVIAEAFEMVEQGFITDRIFTFTNAAMLHTRNNPGIRQGYPCRAMILAWGIERNTPVDNFDAVIASHGIGLARQDVGLPSGNHPNELQRSEIRCGNFS